MIIGLGCQARVGKDTVADYLVGAYCFDKLSFAYSLKEACGIIFNLTEKQLYGDLKEVADDFWGMTPRNILQVFGTDCLRNVFDNDIWVKSLRSQMNIEPADAINYVISDCRFSNEVAAVKEWGGILIKIDRFGDEAGIENETSANHASENALKDFDGWDYVIENKGTKDELFDKIDEVIRNAK